jgi:hypothetical protein
MKKRLTFALLALLIFLSGWLLYRRHIDTARERAFSNIELPHAKSNVAHGRKEPQIERVGGAETNEKVSPVSEMRNSPDTKNDWRAPINFFGRVVDQDNQPVAGATIYFQWTDLSAEGVSETTTMSDSEGFFALVGTTGKNLGVKVHKDGYYVSERDRKSFTYAGENENFVPDSRNPIVFHLRKKTKGEPLVGMKKNFRVARDGTPLEIDLLNGNAVAPGHGHFRVECWTQDEGKKRGEKYDWTCRLSVPGGGFLENTNEFAFLAPESGYQEGVEIIMQASAGREWKKDVERQFYFKLGNGMHGRMTFAMIAAGDHFCMIEALTNPSGSRNLEPDPNAQPKQTQFE